MRKQNRLAACTLLLIIIIVIIFYSSYLDYTDHHSVVREMDASSPCLLLSIVFFILVSVVCSHHLCLLPFCFILSSRHCLSISRYLTQTLVVDKKKEKKVQVNLILVRFFYSFPFMAVLSWVFYLTALDHFLSHFFNDSSSSNFPLRAISHGGRLGKEGEKEGGLAFSSADPPRFTRKSILDSSLFFVWLKTALSTLFHFLP